MFDFSNLDGHEELTTSVMGSICHLKLIIGREFLLKEIRTVSFSGES